MYQKLLNYLVFDFLSKYLSLSFKNCFLFSFSLNFIYSAYLDKFLLEQ